MFAVYRPPRIALAVPLHPVVCSIVCNVEKFISDSIKAKVSRAGVLRGKAVHVIDNPSSDRAFRGHVLRLADRPQALTLCQLTAYHSGDFGRESAWPPFTRHHSPLS
jgi:hypothetical protein